MKLSLVVSVSETKFAAVAFKESYSLAIEKATKWGYDGVELAVRDPAVINVGELKNLLGRYNLEVPALGTGQAYGEEGLSLTSPDGQTREKAKERLKSHVKMASELNSKVIIGLMRGKVSQDSGLEKSLGLLKKSMRDLCDFAMKYNVEFVIEPINRYETNMLNTVDETLEFINGVGRENLKILLDTFHMNIEEPSIFDSIRKARKLIGHVHIADSNRWAPGCGHIDFAGVVNTLNEVGYDGYLSAEILPEPSPDKAGKFNYEYMSKLLVAIHH
ncbi:MAG: sugar phosphate isomerase/epimerase [Candidatus Eremiobacteraeota bacterium]|nr:sugar phosphate isomerase/epimerase [Candidatus Eremiobacteraeota bacterium]